MISFKRYGGHLIQMKALRSNKLFFFGLFAVLLLAIAAAVLYFRLTALVPEDHVKTGFMVTINGVVTPRTSEPGPYPQFVYVFRSVYSSLSNSEQIDYGPIIWNDQIGNFSLTFWFPIESTLVLTADISGCDNRTIYVTPNKNVHLVELTFDSNKCLPTFNIQKDKKELIREVRSSLSGTQTNIKELDIGNETTLLSEDIEKAYEQIRDAENEVNETKSYFLAMRANYLGWRALYRQDLAVLGSCLRKTGKYLSSNESCIVLPYREEQILLAVNKTHLSYQSQYFLKEDFHSVESVDEAEQRIRTIYQEKDEVSKLVSKCQNSLPIVEGSYDNQVKVCSMRENSLKFLNSVMFLLAFTLGVIICGVYRWWIDQ